MEFSFSSCCALPKVWTFLQAAQHGSMQLQITQKSLAVSVSSGQAYMHVLVSLCNDASYMCDGGVAYDIIGH